MKKYIFIIAAILIAIAGFYSCGDPDPDDPNNPGGNPNTPGNGSPNNPFKVATVADLKRVGSGETGPEGFVWGNDKHYKQTADIDLSSVANWETICGEEYGAWFRGTYNGCGYTISNLTISGNENRRGLFGNVSGTISNVRLNEVSISGKQEVGSLVGMLWKPGVIDHCSVNNVEIYGVQSVGGLVGKMDNNSVMNACMITDGKVTGLDTHWGIGGIVGYHAGTIKNCYATVNVEGNQWVGGIAGDQSIGIIQYCYTTGNVNSKNREVGGIAGKSGGNYAKIHYCVALGSKVIKNSSGATYADDPIIGRITSGYYNSATTDNYANNYARIDMVLKAGEVDVDLGTQATLTGIHGADVEAINYHGANSGTWWSSTAGFPTSEWSFDNNRLPWLKGFEGLVQNPTVKN